MATRYSILPAVSSSRMVVETHKVSAASTSSNGFNFYINGFRGLCVLLVFAYHVVNSGLIPFSATPAPGTDAFLFFASSWRYGVELFFMISGFVIINSLRRHHTVSAFLMDRAIRIFPVWIPVHLCVFTLGAALGWKYFGSATWMDKFAVFGANLLLLPPLIPVPVLHPASWSLTYEWLFYLLAAAACALIASRATIPVRVARNLLSLSILCVLILLPRALFFIPGIIIALNWQALTNARWLRFPLLSLVLFLIAWRVVDLDQSRPTTSAIAQVVSSYSIAWSLLAFISSLHLFACVCTGAGIARRLSHASMQLLGNVSYSFYLWHPLVMFAVKKPVTMWLLPHAGWMAAGVVFTVTSFTLSLLISKVSYELIERKLSRRLRAITTGHATVNAAVASPPTVIRSKGAI